MRVTSGWNGEPLGEGDLALLVLSNPSRADDPTPALATARTGEAGCVVPADRLGAFLRAHAGHRLVCHDAAELHWALARYLLHVGDTEALAALWGFSRDSRLLDISLLDRLVRLAEDGNQRPPRSALPALAIARCDVTLVEETWDRVRLGAAGLAPFVPAEEVLAGAASITDTILRVYGVLSRMADLLAVRLNIPVGTRSEFGPLGLGLQVQAAIAAHHARHNGLRLDPEQRTALLHACDTAVEASLQTLCQDRAARRFVKRGGGQIKYDRDGAPYLEPDRLRAWLATELETMRAMHGLHPDPPRDEAGKISIDLADWGVLAHCQRQLRIWADLVAAGRIRASLRSSHPDIHPQYDVLPTIRTADPDLDQLRRLQPAEAFQPTEGHAFLVVGPAELELRALAVVCERHHGPSRLAELLRSDQDPVTYLAAALQGSAPGTFAGLGGTAPDSRRWLQLARGLLLLAPAGLGPENINQVIEADLGVEAGPAEVTRLHARTVEEVFPELARYLTDDSLTVAAKKLGCSRTTLYQHIPTDHGLDIVHPDTREEALRKILRGDTRPSGQGYGSFVRRTWGQLRAINRNPELVESLQRQEGSPALYRALYGRDVVTLAGRVRGRLLYSEARRSEYLDLADDALKAILYALVADGFQLAAVAGHEAVLEVPTDADRNQAVARAEQQARAAAEEVLQGMPVPCPAQWLERW